MKKPYMFALLLSIGLSLVAQQYTTKDLGKVTTRAKTDVLVSVDSAGTIILSTPAHSIYIDRSISSALGNTLDAVLAGMRDLEGKDISIVDYRVIGKLTNDGSRDNTVDGIVFRLELNTTKDDKVLLSMFATRDAEDMIFTTSSVAQLDDLVKTALKSSTAYNDQYAYIESVIQKIGTTAFK